MAGGPAETAAGGQRTPKSDTGKERPDSLVSQPRVAPGGERSQLRATPPEPKRNPDPRSKSRLRGWWDKIPPTWQILASVISVIAAVLAILTPLGIIGGS